MNRIKEIQRINERERELGISVGKGSWHDRYKDSNYVYVGGLNFDLTEGDILCVFSQYAVLMKKQTDRTLGMVKSMISILFGIRKLENLEVSRSSGTKNSLALFSLLITSMEWRYCLQLFLFTD